MVNVIHNFLWTTLLGVSVKMLQYKKIDLSERIDTNKVHQKNVCFVIIGTLKMLDLNLTHMFVTNVTIY